VRRSIPTKPKRTLNDVFKPIQTVESGLSNVK